MKLIRGAVPAMFVLLCAVLTQSQQTTSATNNAVVPPVIQFSNVAEDAAGNPLSGSVEITFSLYDSSLGETPLWSETQNVSIDNSGRYSVYVGVTKPNGVPMALFTNAAAHWLGVQIAGQAEQPRVFLVSVPYAMKAGDAATIGGLPPSAFVMSGAPNSNHSSNLSTKPHANSPATETQNYIPLFTDGSGNLGNSLLYEAGGNEIGIGTIAPTATLEVNGTTKFDGLATFNSGQTFPNTVAGITGTNSISITGTKDNPIIGINTTFANMYYPQLNAANIFTKSQTVNGMITATSFTGNGAALGNVNAALLNGLASSAFQPAGNYATLSANTFTGNQTVNGNVNVGSSNGLNIGGIPFVFGSATFFNAFLGGAGNFTMTGAANTAVGSGALASDTNGGDNTAHGYKALYANSTGIFNVAVGDNALVSNTTASNNTATGHESLYQNTTGINNTAAGSAALVNNSIGDYNVADGNNALEFNTAGFANTGVGNSAGKTGDDTALTGKNDTALGTGAGFSTGTLNNASAIGANAMVGESNALVLGSISGVNGQTVTANVGIGTTTPDNNLSVNGSADKPGGGSWATFSDRRLKTLNGSFNSGLSEILKLHPVRYRYKEDNAMGIRDHDEHVGMVAQEVKKVIPEAVSENGKGYLLVNNDPIIWTMLNAIKQQQREIVSLRSQLQKHAAKETALNVRLSALEHGRAATELASAGMSSAFTRK